MKLVSLMLISLSAFGERLGTGSATSNGVTVHYESRLEPGSPPITKHGGGVLVSSSVIKRHLCNFDNNTYFGYDLTVQPIADGRYRMQFAPLTITPAEMSKIYDKVPNWTALPLPGGSVSMEIRAGETVALDLFVNPSTRQKVTDYLTIKSTDGHPTASESARIAGPARDFSPEDASIELHSPKVSVDGKPVASTGGMIAGNAIWIDLPGHGRFVFSLAPRPDLGMDKAGEIRGKTMTWRSGGREYTIVTSEPITGGSRAYNLYVFQIPRNVTTFGISAGPRPDDPIRRQ